MISCKRKPIVWWLCLSIISAVWNTSSSLSMIVNSNRRFTGNNRRINADLTKVLTKQSFEYCPVQLHAKEIKAILLNTSYHNELFDIDTKTFTAAIRSCNCTWTTNFNVIHRTCYNYYNHHQKFIHFIFICSL
jgi:hypothetical protein